MNMPDEKDWKAEQMRAKFEASIAERLRRASSVQLQQFIPSHWFSAAASECAAMYIAGFFYGAISLTQAYVEALSKFLAEHHHVPVRKDVGERCQRLHAKGIISADALSAALTILDDRNDFHHLNKDIEQDFQKLTTRAECCINLIYVLESEVFAFSFTEENPGVVVLKTPDYWPSEGPTLTKVHLRAL
jgi:hypothetical protein